MKVYVNTPDRSGRKLIDVELVKDRETTVLVRLDSGKLITRKKVRDLPKEVV